MKLPLASLCMNNRESPILSRRDWMRQSVSGLCFVIPIFGGGKLGQPVLAPGPWFVDVAKQAGLSAFRNTCGTLAKDYLLEEMGNGVALFDYNNDGLLDIFMVNGSSFELLDNPGLPRTSSRLFRNNGDGTFTDVTRQSGLINEGWGMAAAAADFDTTVIPIYLSPTLGLMPYFITTATVRLRTSPGMPAWKVETGAPGAPGAIMTVTESSTFTSRATLISTGPRSPRPARPNTASIEGFQWPAARRD